MGSGEGEKIFLELRVMSGERQTDLKQQWKEKPCKE